jgi:hypothetical protein
MLTCDFVTNNKSSAIILMPSCLRAQLSSAYCRCLARPLDFEDFHNAMYTLTLRADRWRVMRLSPVIPNVKASEQSGWLLLEDIVGNASISKLRHAAQEPADSNASACIRLFERELVT